MANSYTTGALRPDKASRLTSWQDSGDYSSNDAALADQEYQEALRMSRAAKVVAFARKEVA